MREYEQWNGFEGKNWKNSVDVRDFIQNNYKPYDGDERFLVGPTEGTEKLWGKLQKLQKEERAKGGVLDMETEIVSGLTAYGPGYISEELKDLETVVGLQTDKPLKRAFMPTAESRWLSRLVQLMDISQVKSFMRFLQNIIKHTIREYLIFTHLR